MAPISGAYADVGSPHLSYSPVSSYFASPQPLPIPPPRLRYPSSTKPTAKFLEEMVAEVTSASGSSSTKLSGASLDHRDPKGKAPEVVSPELPLNLPKHAALLGSQSSSSSSNSTSSETLSHNPEVSHIGLPPSPPPKSYSRYERPTSRTSSRGPVPREYATSRNSKPGPSVPRRILNDILNFCPHLSERSERGTGSHETASYSTREDPSPTDSHQHPRARRPSDSHTHSQSHTHSRTHRSHTSSESISTILIMTTERLHSETARANAAEKQATEVMSLFKNTHEAKVRLEKDLTRVKEELGMYKIQLDVAQKEIFRAQEVVDRVDRQRAEAEEAAARARERNRKLVEARAVDIAMEEGRRVGFEEGLKQGRILAEMVVPQEEYYDSPPRRSRRDEKNSTSSSKSSSSQSSGGSRRTSSSIRRPPSTVPAPSRSTTVPLRVPSTQPPLASVSSQPEDISVQEPTAPIKPISIYNHSPSASHRSIVLPDNYIPTLNADSTITLPPPHDFSQPILTATAPEPTRPSSTRGRLSTRPEEAGPSSSSRLGHRSDRRYPPPTRATSVGSPQSTHISELDLVSPPRHRPDARSERQREKMRQRASTVTAAPPPTHERVERWRDLSRGYGRPTTPASPTPRREAPDPNRIIPKNDIERPTTAEPRSPSTYPNRPPRRPREVVMPMPLGDQLLQINTAANAGPPRWVHTSRTHDNTPSATLAPTQPPTAIRTVSNTTVPGIEVVTPSTHSLRSEKSFINPVLLTPDHAHTPVHLPPAAEELTEQALDSYDSEPEEVITGVLPDNNLPPGFVPLSPIPGMSNLKSYPPGFAPSLPKGPTSAAMSSTHIYPSSPLALARTDS
ncbi:hypothetical protein CPB83DRAFT_70442 [Crepidotus variabilis]|uniref:Uncharacterized protein n=1 Tax=Crepidotus variabilis TaxID=179855 RepID=A0A9P6JJ55_9AGAR|nr:hypothetical protein CPB83DRAFT_70442 [Crepidotus variabilis]